MRHFPLKPRALSIYQEIPQLPVGMLMEHTFSKHSTEKFPGISGILKRESCFPVGNFPLKSMFHLRVFTRNRQFLAIHDDICATIFGDESISEWNLCQVEHALHSMDLSIEVSESFW